MKNTLLVAFFLLFAFENSFSQQTRSESESFLFSLLYKKDSLIDVVLNNPEKYNFQLIFTRIDKTKKEKKFETFSINEGNQYFYPASLIKFPLALVALEKLTAYRDSGIHITDSIIVNTCGCDVATNKYVSKSKKPNLLQFLREMTIMSNNDAYNLYFDLVGRDLFNTKMNALNLDGIMLKNRFTANCGEEGNNLSGGIKFIKSGLLSKTSFKCIKSQKTWSIDSTIYPIKAGKKYLKNGKIVNEPKDYSYTNYVSLIQAHELMVDLMNNGSFKNYPFSIDEEYKKYYIKALGDFPRELLDSQYDTTKYPDYYYKFFIDPKVMNTKNGTLRVYNKVGLASGFISDVSYFIDTQNNIEYGISAAILCKNDAILDNGKYNYYDLGIPLLRKIGALIYNHQKTNK